MVTLDVVIATYQRPQLVAKTLASIAAADVPATMSITVYVVENRVEAGTAAVVAQFASESARIRFEYLFEPRAGKSYALNTAITLGQGDLVATVDDDEEIDSNWFAVIERCFREEGVDFIGGPYVPNWGAPKPDWVSATNGSIVGWVDGGPRRQRYGTEYQGVLMGGNSVFARRVFARVGLYDANLGRTDKGLLSCEDDELYQRVLDAGFVGYYIPELIIHHYIPPERLTRGYHRRWAWGHGISAGFMARKRPSGSVEWFGVPRWQIRKGLAGAGRRLAGLIGLAPAEAAFAGELDVLSVAGFIYGRHLRRPQPAPPATAKSQVPA